MIAVTCAVSLGLTAASCFGSKETSQPVGAVPASLTSVSAAVPVLATMSGMRLVVPDRPVTLRRWSAVAKDSCGVPVTSACSLS